MHTDRETSVKRMWWSYRKGFLHERLMRVMCFVLWKCRDNFFQT